MGQREGAALERRDEMEAGLTKGSTGAAEASILTYIECSSAARSTQALDPCVGAVEDQCSDCQ